MDIELTLIVPTYNRSEYLKKSLPTFFNQSLDKDIYEIIVVDNNSNDNTKDIIKKLFKNTKHNTRYVFEPHPGLHNARNRGILEAKGEIVVFGDDDIKADKDWLKNIYTEFETNEKAGVVGGKILPIWSKKPPLWINLYGSKKMNATLVYLDYGNKRKVLNDKYLWGCNFAVRKSLALEAGGSYPDAPRYESRQYHGSGEIGLTKAIKQLDYQVVYLPNAIVYHHIHESRLNFEYFLKRRRKFAISAIYDYLNNNFTISSFFKLSYQTLRRFIKVHLVYLLKRPSGVEYKKNKMDRVYYDEQIRQLLRILFNKNLREFIKQKNYFEELI